MPEGNAESVVKQIERIIVGYRRGQSELINYVKQTLNQNPFRSGDTEPLPEPPNRPVWQTPQPSFRHTPEGRAGHLLSLIDEVGETVVREQWSEASFPYLPMPYWDHSAVVADTDLIGYIYRAQVTNNAFCSLIDTAHDEGSRVPFINLDDLGDVWAEHEEVDGSIIHLNTRIFSHEPWQVTSAIIAQELSRYINPDEEQSLITGVQVWEEFQQIRNVFPYPDTDCTEAFDQRVEMWRTGRISEITEEVEEAYAVH